ncbi:MAG: FAD-dependent oxidoreductase [Oscillospiraceae bacterium]|nr:FAD-dependent oxidoreductase [Oscillospiraceae bacterium]
MYKNYDIIIVGSGVAGLYAALHLDAAFRVLVLSKGEVAVSNSSLAQGGISAVIDTENDSCETFISDTLKAGGNQNNLQNLTIMVEQSRAEIENLVGLGVDFDRDKSGNLALALEGGHSKKRIVFHRDSTGSEVTNTLVKRVRERSNITLLENAHLLNLEKLDGFFTLNINNNCYISPTCILATGGIGGVYNYTTNSPSATGDGIYFAHKIGAVIKDLSLVQFHPTAFANANDFQSERFLISEAVRGEGAYLLNCNGERFMQNYDARLELAPRDVVSRSILAEQNRTGSAEFFLDLRHKNGEYIQSRFPQIHAKLLTCNIDMTQEPVPIYPCQHYIMGGIETGGNGETAVSGLYAAGECSCTGVHGNNRLASNSLLEALVFSRRAATHINANAPRNFSAEIQLKIPPGATPTNIDYAPIRTELRNIMQRAYFITPDYAEIRKNLPRIAEIKQLLESENLVLTPELIETKALATTAYLILS